MVRSFAVRQSWVRTGDRRHHLHNVGITRLGGVGIFISYSISLSLLVLGYKLMGRNPIYITQIIESVAPAAILIFAVGLADDIFDVPAWSKFVVQIAAAAYLFLAGLRVNPLVFGNHHLSLPVSFLLTVLWVAGITNAFNLIDGLDGLAAGSAMFSTAAVFMVGLIGGNRPVAMITIGLTGAILGFLRFNFNPATIFLGDSGSLFIGFVLSAISLAGSQKSPTLVAVAIPVVACGLPILDTSIAIFRRFISGKPIFGADREHIHHKLLKRGLTHRQAVIVLYGISALCAFMSLFLLYPGAGTAGVVLAVLGLAAWLGLQQLDYREINELKRLARRPVDQRRILSNNLSVQYAIEHLPLAKSMDEVTALLRDMFESNDFDGFDFHVWESAGVSVRSFDSIWRKTEVESSKGNWNIGLRLVSSDGVERGQLILYRGYFLRPLLVDVNLLTSGFQAALAERLAALSSQDIQAIKEPSPATLPGQ